MEEIQKEFEMDSQNISQNPQEEYPSESQETTEDVEKEVLDKEKLEQLNKQLYARLKRLEKKLSEVEPKKSDKQDDEWKAKIDFLIRHKELEPDELEVVSAYARGSGKSLDEAYKDPAVEGALKHLREKKAAERAMAESSSRSESEESSLLAKLKAGKLSDEEFKKNFKQIQKEALEKFSKNRSFE